jgi:hypothetical protein
MRSIYLPPTKTAAKLFATGATVGPIVDSLHNQCLLQYDILPISLLDQHFASSWLIPPLLGVAYVVLGGVLPRIFDSFLSSPSKNSTPSSHFLRDRAVFAVLSTAAIIKLSEFLQTHPADAIPILGTGIGEASSSTTNLVIMSVAALVQWIVLDTTPAALASALITAIGGPLSELPFVASHCWHYIPEAADYLPLSSLTFLPEYTQQLTLSSITGPCYFAVTMDAIALGRWFDSFSSSTNNDQDET